MAIRRALQQHGVALFYATMAAEPVTTLMLQSLLTVATGLQLRTGDALLHLFATGIAGVIGLLLFAVEVYRGRRSRAPWGWLAVVAFFAATVVAALWLMVLGHDARCGGSMGEWGRWI